MGSHSAFHEFLLKSNELVVFHGIGLPQASFFCLSVAGTLRGCVDNAHETTEKGDHDVGSGPINMIEMAPETARSIFHAEQHQRTRLGSFLGCVEIQARASRKWWFSRTGAQRTFWYVSTVSQKNAICRPSWREYRRSLEQFQQKCAAVLRPGLRNHKKLEHFRISKKNGNALAAFLFIFIAGSFFAPEKAHADFRVCNTTQNLVGVALGYRAKSGWVTEGWWHVNASSCTTLVVGPLTSRYYYLYAEDAQSGGRWDGRVNMCVAENQFKITGINDCFARGFQRSGFQEYDTGEQTSWMVQLTEENPPSSPIVTDTPSP